MKKFKLMLKILLGVVVTLILLIAIGIFVLVKWVNPNQFKPEIIQMVHEQTGRNLTLNGDLAWSFYPRLGIHIGEASVSNPPGFAASTFAEMNSADLALDTWALLHGKIEVNTLSVDGLHVFLVEEGSHNNWTFVPIESATAQKSSNLAKGAAGYSALNMMIQNFSVTHAALDYDDDQKGQHDRFTQLSIKVSGMALNHAFPVDIALSFDVPHVIQGELKVYALMEYDVVKNTLTLRNVHFILNNSLEGTMNLLLQNFAALQYSGNITIPAFSVPSLMKSLNLSAPVLANPKILDSVSFSSQVEGGLTHLNLSKINASIGSSQVQGQLSFPSFTLFSLNESLQMNQLDVADYADLKGARLMLKGINVAGTFSASNMNASQSVNMQSVILKGYSLDAVLQNVNQLVDGLLSGGATLQSFAMLPQSIHNLQAGMALNPALQTNLGVLKAQIEMRHGVITTPIMTVQGPLLSGSGAGVIDLNQKALNYNVITNLTNANGKGLKGLTIPAHIGGTFQNPAVSLDWNAIQKQVLAALSKQGLRTLKNGASTSGDTVKQATSALQSLFGNP